MIEPEWDAYPLSSTTYFTSIGTMSAGYIATNSTYQPRLAQVRNVYIPGPEREVEVLVEKPVPQIGSYRAPEGMTCVAHGWGCDGVHDDWCRRGLPHTDEKCDGDCRAWTGSGEFTVKAGSSK